MKIAANLLAFFFYLLCCTVVCYARSAESQKEVGVSAVEVGENRSNTRIGITVKGHSANTATVVCRFSSAVSITNGFEISAGAAASWGKDDQPAGALYCVSGSASQRVSVVETLQ